MIVRLQVTGPRAATLALSGVLDHGHVHEVEEVLPGIPPGADLLVDLGGVTGIDSSGLGCLLRAREQCGPEGGVRLRLGSRSVTTVIRMAGFERIFTIEEPGRD